MSHFTNGSEAYECEAKRNNEVNFVARKKKAKWDLFNDVTDQF